MIVPSLDLCGGKAVQLVQGEELAIDAGDPRPIMEQFSMVGEVAVIDIDAARGEGDNSALIRQLCRIGPARVGGGIRDIGTALSWLDAGATKVIIGTAASPSFLSQLPRERVVAAIDARDGTVVTNGWRTNTGDALLDKVEELSRHCGEVLVTFVEREGLREGTDVTLAAAVARAAGDARVTIAGGITRTEEIRTLDRMGVDSQVGMALYGGDISLAEAFAAPLVSDRDDGLWPTVVVDESGVCLGLAWSSIESLTLALESRAGIYQSRARGIWEKGATSGATQELVRVGADCDRDSLRFVVRQAGSFCHMGTRTCWGPDWGIPGLARRLRAIAASPDSGNTSRLLVDPSLLESKLSEEAAELGASGELTDVTHEAADLLYFLLVKVVAAGVSLGEIEAELDRRALRVSRRPMRLKR